VGPRACLHALENSNLLPLPRSKLSQHKAHSLNIKLTLPMKPGWEEREQEREREIKRKKETQNTAGGLSFVTIHF